MSKPPKLLLVEDHVDTLVVTAKLLRGHGYVVTTARSKTEAMQLCELDHFDLLIGDLGLPDGSGLDLMREVAAKCKIKGIAYTGYGFEADIAQSRAAGYSVHLTKPTELNVLFETIDRLLLEAQA